VLDFERLFDVETCPLTTGLNNFSGDALNNSFDATVIDSLSINDTLDGGAGTDQLTAYLSGTALASGVSINNIETVSIVSTGGGFTLDVSTAGKYADLKTLTVEAGTGGAIAVTTKSNVTSVSTIGGAANTITDSGTVDTLTTASVTKNITTAAVITSDVLSNLTVADSAVGATVTAAAGTRTLNLTVNKMTAGTIADAEATTLNVTASGNDSTLTALSAAKATTVTFAGDKVLTSGGETFTVATSITSTNTGGVKLTTALGTAVTFTGGAGEDTVSLGATTKAITMGGGNDRVLSAGLVGTGGSVDAGEGTGDTIVMTTAQAVTAGTDAVFNTKFTNFEVLELNNALAGTVNLAGVNRANKVVLTAGGGDLATAILTGMTSGGTIKQTGNGTGSTVVVDNATFNTADVLNIELSKNGILAAGTLTTTNVERVNITTTDAVAAGSAAAIHTLTLVDIAATGITVSGNNGLNLTNAGNVAVTSFDASGVVANGTADTAANLAVTFLSANTTTTATVTIKGGDGNDTLTGIASIDVITGGKGDDTIGGADGADTLDGGAGADLITGGLKADLLTGGAGADSFIITSTVTNTAASLHSTGTIGGAGNAGTITGFDTITDLETGIVAADKDKIDFSVAGVKAAAAAAGNFTDSALFVSGQKIASHVVDANGLVKFTNDSTTPAAVNITSDAELAAVVQYLAGGDIGDAGATVIFNATYATATRGATARTFVYQQTTTDAATAAVTDGYTLVDLAGVTLLGVEATASTTDKYLFIA
jgi:hypothetical protein